MQSPQLIATLALLIVVPLLQACGAPPSARATPTSAEVGRIIAATATDTPQAARPTVTLALTPTAGPTQPLVTITARGGDLAIRAGPDMVFDAIAALRDGESATALARSVLVGWLQIPIASMPGVSGWVSIQTRFSVVEGQVLDLPKIMTVEWPVGSYLRNCTSHRLIVEPGGTVLPPVEQAPANRVWFHPAVYHIYDLDLPGRPEVTGIQLGSHIEVDIVEDGANQRGVCP